MASVEVEAKGPIQAAEIVLRERLATKGAGDRFRAMVWRLDEKYSPISTKLFRR